MDGGAWHQINTTTTSAATPASEQLSYLLQTIQECKCTTGGGAELHRFAHCCRHPHQQQPVESGYVTTRSSASSGSGSSSDEDQLRDLLMVGQHTHTHAHIHTICLRFVCRWFVRLVRHLGTAPRMRC